VIKPKPNSIGLFSDRLWVCGMNGIWMDGHGWQNKCPYGQPGDRLWIRETFCDLGGGSMPGRVLYKASFDDMTAEMMKQSGHGIPIWKPSIHIPRWASRITLEIVSVKVERLQDISEEDAIAEGYIGLECKHTYSEYGCTDCLNTGWIEPPTLDFMLHWNPINGKKYPWELNPWVWVIEFKTLDK
jgi:hypothetical protein